MCRKIIPALGSTRIYPPVKLVFGFIFKDDGVYRKACAALARRFGEFDFESETLDFGYTDYYQDEFGKKLKRKFASSKKLIKPHDLYKIKIYTNQIEKGLSRDSRRLINIDPGYLDLSKFVLATTKDFYHRIYLNKGIFAELALYYQDKAFKALEWTYPDYRTAEYMNILKQIRQIYHNQCRQRI